MKNDNEGVGTPSGPRVLASRSLRPDCYRGDLANSKILTAMSLFGFLLPEELCGLDHDGFDVAIAARFAVNEDFELSAEWISNLRLPIMGKPTRPAWRKRIKGALI
jgi:hypothetical protein